ncbi:hypothetical protein H0X48_06095 [Candidatus Dependentiae bacterium]|nr:hypothetical protein [Candidatus Dependentiae bacterium]
MKLKALMGLVLAINMSVMCAQPAKAIGAQQARNYIGHVIDSLFVPSMHDGRYAQEIKDFVTQATQELLKVHGVFDKAKTAKVYKAVDLCTDLNERVIDFIDHKCKDYIQKEISTAAYTLTTVQKRRITQRVATQFHNKVVDILYYADQLPAGALMSYVGSPLRNKVINAVKTEIKLTQTTRVSPKSTVLK